jgi:hypothetical protein
MTFESVLEGGSCLLAIIAEHYAYAADFVGTLTLKSSRAY